MLPLLLNRRAPCVKAGDDVYIHWGVLALTHAKFTTAPAPTSDACCIYRPHPNLNIKTQTDPNSWSPMTAEEFRSSQLRHLRRKVGRVRRLLYPGLSEALKANLGRTGAAALGGDGSTASRPPPPDGHVRRCVTAATGNGALFFAG